MLLDFADSLVLVVAISETKMTRTKSGMGVLLAGLLLCAGVHAQVFHCPPAYPRETHALVGDTNAFATTSRLIRGSVYIGDFGGQGEMQGYRRDNKTGADVTYGLPERKKKWFVCEYGESSITMWTAIDDKAAARTMQERIRGGEVAVKAECK